LVRSWSFPAGDGPFVNVPVVVAGLTPARGEPGLRNKAGGGVEYLWTPTPAAEVLKIPGDIPGQNVSDPVASFNNHVIVKVDYLDPDTNLRVLKYYDPSYGATYTSLTDMNNQAIAGFYNPVNTTPISFSIRKRQKDTAQLVEVNTVVTR
jgi:hypothetical protein